MKKIFLIFMLCILSGCNDVHIVELHVNTSMECNLKCIQLAHKELCDYGLSEWNENIMSINNLTLKENHVEKCQCGLYNCLNLSEMFGKNENN